MRITDFNMTNKGAANAGPNPADLVQHEFTYVVADDNARNFHAFFDEHEAWINHRDDGNSLNIDKEMVKKLMNKEKA